MHVVSVQKTPILTLQSSGCKNSDMTDSDFYKRKIEQLILTVNNIKMQIYGKMFCTSILLILGSSQIKLYINQVTCTISLEKTPQITIVLGQNLEMSVLFYEEKKNYHTNAAVLC